MQFLPVSSPAAVPGRGEETSQGQETRESPLQGKPSGSPVGKDDLFDSVLETPTGSSQQSFSRNHQTPLGKSGVGPGASATSSWGGFWVWLQKSLDDLGLDATLYGRCVLSILRQPSRGYDKRMDVEDRSGDLTPVKDLHLSENLKILTDRMSRKESSGYGSGDGMQSGTGSEDTTRSALLDCLKTVDMTKKEMERFVSEILEKYEDAKDDLSLTPVATRGGNDSIDSGVCPSPEENFQNYDEAFPPLAPGAETPRNIDIVDLEFLAPESTPESPEGEVLDESMDEKSVLSVETLGKFSPESFPIFDPTSFYTNSFDGDFKKTRAMNVPQQQPTFTIPGSRQLRSCPVQQEHAEHQRAEGGAASAKQPRLSRPPHFIIPKFTASSANASFKVGSCPTKLEFGFSGPPALGDLSGWLCAQSGGNQQGSESSSSGGMFDAPRFILHIINEDEQNNLPLHHSPLSSRHRVRSGNGKLKTERSQEPTKVFPQKSDPAPIPNLDWISAYHPSTLPEDFSIFQPPAGGIPDIGDSFQCPEKEGKGPATPVEFCMPKMNEIASNNNPGPFYQLPEMPEEHEIVPITELTHFVPIIGENMEGAFVPKPKHLTPGDYATDSYQDQEYFVLREQQIRASLLAAQNIRSSILCNSGGERRMRESEVEPRSLPLKFKAERPVKECQTEQKAEGNPWDNGWAETNNCLLPFLTDLSPSIGMNSSGGEFPLIPGIDSIWDDCPHSPAGQDCWSNTQNSLPSKDFPIGNGIFHHVSRSAIDEDEVFLNSAPPTDAKTDGTTFGAIAKFDTPHRSLHASSSFGVIGPPKPNRRTRRFDSVSEAEERAGTKKDEEEDDQLLNFVANIALVSPLLDPSQ